MLFSEYQAWVKYRNLRGSLSTPRRLEQTLARVCHLITLAAGFKKDQDTKEPYSVIDFMPHEDGFAESQREITFEELMLREIANGNA
jgi:hypothetical protein